MWSVLSVTKGPFHSEDNISSQLCQSTIQVAVCTKQVKWQTNICITGTPFTSRVVTADGHTHSDSLMTNCCFPLITSTSLLTTQVCVLFSHIRNWMEYSSTTLTNSVAPEPEGSSPEPEGSSPYSQEPTTGPYPEPTGSNLHSLSQSP
jgi:hypothetical protein